MTNIRNHTRSAGVGLVTAIFLVVVLAGLAVAMIAVSSSQQSSRAMDEQGARAYQAARAGIEWAVYMQTQGGGCPGLSATVADATTSFNLPNDSVLRDFSVTVRCQRKGAAADPLMRIVITATACAPAPAGTCPAFSNNPDYVQRVIEAEI